MASDPRLPSFARWSAGEVPSGHAACQVVATLEEVVIVDFGGEFAWMRAVLFPGVVVGDFLTIGPAVSRWRVTPKAAR